MTALLSSLSVIAAGEPSVPESALRTASAVFFALGALGTVALLIVGARLALHPPSPPWSDRVRRVRNRPVRGRDLLELAAVIAACQGLFFFVVWPIHEYDDRLRSVVGRIVEVSLDDRFVIVIDRLLCVIWERKSFVPDRRQNLLFQGRLAGSQERLVVVLIV